MGSPELPDPGEDEVHPTQFIQHVPMASDESDNEVGIDYDGYELLSMEEQEPEAHTYATTTTLQTAPLNYVSDDQYIEDEQIGRHPTIPHVESADVEIERQVWNEPRPDTLQIEIDSMRTEQILSAMANFTLPATVVPDWAAGISDERWKEELLQLIRQRKEMSCDQGETNSDE